MARVVLEQPVAVHSVPPAGEQISGVNEGEEHVHSFPNLIPACEFAVSLAKEGHRRIAIKLGLWSALTLEEAQRIVDRWHSGQVPADAEEIEY